MQFFPKGAIQTADALKIGDIVYAGWSYARKPQAFIVIGVPCVNQYGSHVVPAVTTYSNDRLTQTHIYLGDLNIGKSHNDHFLFADERDAITYCDYCNGAE